MDDRLLSEKQMIDICGNGCSTYECKTSECHARLIADSQLIKTDMEWIGWIESTIRLCDDHDCHKTYGGCHLGFIHCKKWKERKETLRKTQ